MPKAVGFHTECQKTIARDVRVDRVGYVQELDQLWAKPIKDAVKARMAADGLEIVEGDRYQGKFALTSSTSIDARKFYKLFKSGEITEKDFLSAIKVERGPLKTFLTERDITDISETEAGSPRFSIARIKGIDVTLAEAIKSLTDTLAGAEEGA